MVRKKADDVVIRAMMQSIFIDLGRAIGLSCIAATCGERTEDHAIEAADKAWSNLADKLMDYARDT